MRDYATLFTGGDLFGCGAEAACSLSFYCACWDSFVIGGRGDERNV